MNNVLLQTSKEAKALLGWYDLNARELPWRVGPDAGQRGARANPYHVWLSEIMLQQTQVKTVIAYYLKFLKLWPRLSDLASADVEDVLKAWAGLGYYSRARNLKKCADILVKDFGGAFPTSAAELIKLPGIGAYTSAAIAAISFDQPIAVVDGNVERVMARYCMLSTPLPKVKQDIKQQVEAILPVTRPGDFAQAMMDLGATICTPQNPVCDACPLHQSCKARDSNSQHAFPVKLTKKPVAVRKGAVFLAFDKDDQILLRKRGARGMLAGMSEFPSSLWSAQKDGVSDTSAAPFEGDWQCSGVVRHQFTHFKLELQVYWCRTDFRRNVEGWWVAQDAVLSEALPNLYKKAFLLVTDTNEDIFGEGIFDA